MYKKQTNIKQKRTQTIIKSLIQKRETEKMGNGSYAPTKVPGILQ